MPRSARAAGAACVVLVAATLALVSVTVPAFAAALGPHVSGSVTGEAKRGDVITFRVVATEPGGFQNLATVQIVLLLHSVALDQIAYDRAENAVSTPESLAVPVGSHFTATGTFLQVSGRAVDVTTGGDRLALRVRARVVHEIPRASQFSLGAVDTSYLVARVSRAARIPEPTSGGFSWTTLLLAVLVALFAGGFVGNLFAGRRPAPPKASVYDAMRRRMEQESTSR